MTRSKQLIFRGDSGWNEAFSVNQDDQITIISHTDQPPQPVFVPAKVTDDTGFNTGIQVKAGQNVSIHASGTWYWKQRWSQTFNFRGAQSHGWNGYIANLGPNGWQHEPSTSPYIQLRRVLIATQFEPTQLTQVSVTYSLQKGRDTYGPGSKGQDWAFVVNNRSDANTKAVNYDHPIITFARLRSVTEAVQRIDYSQLAPRDRVVVDIICSKVRPNHQLSGSVTVHEVTIKGLGTNPFWVHRTDSARVGPDGDRSQTTNNRFPNSNATAYSLLARVGMSGAWQPIGANGEFTPSDEGTLYLAMNDDDYSDNAGSLQAYVEVSGRTDTTIPACDAAETRIHPNQAADRLVYRIGTSGKGTIIGGDQVDFTAARDGVLRLTTNGCITKRVSALVLANAPDDPANQNQACDDCDDGINAAGQPCS